MHPKIADIRKKAKTQYLSDLRKGSSVGRYLGLCSGRFLTINDGEVDLFSVIFTVSYTHECFLPVKTLSFSKLLIVIDIIASYRKESNYKSIFKGS